MRSSFYLLDMTALLLSPPLFFRSQAVPRRPPRLAGRPSIPLFGLVAGHLVPLSTINILTTTIYDG
jgi:hypothetical protein